MKKTLCYQPLGDEEKLAKLKIGSYRGNMAVFAALVSVEFKDAGVPFKMITANPDISLPPYFGAVHGDDKGLVKMLLDSGLGELTNYIVHSGFRTLWVFAFSEAQMMAYDPDGTEEYKTKIKSEFLSK